LSRRNSKNSRIPESDFYLWAVFFLYSAIVAVAVQWIILPFILPSLHWGEGLLKGTDSISYHLMAKERAALIAKEGWHNWLLSPSGQTPAGVASLFYALFAPKPWVLIPLLAGLHAGAVLLLFKINFQLESGQDRLAAFYSVLPLLVFPSAVFWYAQIQRDAFFIFGNLLFIFLWVRWLTYGNLETMLSIGTFLLFGISWIVAFFSAWFVRPYWGQVLFIQSLMILLIITIREFPLFLRNRTNRPRRVIYWILTLMVVLGLGAGYQFKKLPDAVASDAPVQEQVQVKQEWIPTPWLPKAIDSALQGLALNRQGFFIKYPGAGTNIDKEVSFHKAGDIAGYLFRALYIGFFMPTYQLAFQKGVNPGGTLMRWVTGGEMLFLYLTYPFLIWAIWTWRKKLELWIVLIWGLSGLLLFALVCPNIGALYRFRYGFLMTLSAIGILRGCLSLKARKGISLA